MGLMDSADIQNIWQAIQESEWSDEKLWPHANAASDCERAVTERPDGSVWTREHDVIRRQHQPATSHTRPDRADDVCEL
jgi:hypothetical protein